MKMCERFDGMPYAFIVCDLLLEFSKQLLDHPSWAIERMKMVFVFIASDDIAVS